MELNNRAQRLCQELEPLADELRISRQSLSNGAVCWDFGVHAVGGLQAGLQLSRVCLADLAEVWLHADDESVWNGPAISVRTDAPLAACLASQYAGWKIDPGDFFAMGSGPMRAAASSEPLFERIGHQESPDRIVGVLETGRLPTEQVAHWISECCRVKPNQLTLLAARTASHAGTIQIVARSVETALHKLLELDFDVHQIVSGFGTAPLPPVAADDLMGIGRTNDAILYGGRVTLWIDGDDDQLADIVSKIPSCASSDFGSPFGDIFARYDHDFYRIDPHLFSPAFVRLVNLASGRSYQAGATRADVLKSSFIS